MGCEFQTVESADYLCGICRSTIIANNSPILMSHVGLKHPAKDSEITTGMYYPKCDYVFIMCETRDKAQKLLEKYSNYKISNGNGVFTNERAFKTITMKFIKGISKKFKFIRKEMIINNCVAAAYRFGLGIGAEFNDNDYVVFLKSSAVETIKYDAPHIRIQPGVVISPLFTLAKKNQNVLLKTDDGTPTILHTVTNYN